MTITSRGSDRMAWPPRVLFLPEVVNQFLELAEILYQKGYLGNNHVIAHHLSNEENDM
jgi:hypothetical protein